VLSRCLVGINLCGSLSVGLELFACFTKTRLSCGSNSKVRPCVRFTKQSEVFLVFSLRMVLTVLCSGAPYWVCAGSVYIRVNPSVRWWQDWPNTLDARTDAFSCAVHLTVHRSVTSSSRWLGSFVVPRRTGIKPISAQKATDIRGSGKAGAKEVAWFTVSFIKWFFAVGFYMTEVIRPLGLALFACWVLIRLIRQ